MLCASDFMLWAVTKIAISKMLEIIARASDSYINQCGADEKLKDMIKVDYELREKEYALLRNSILFTWNLLTFSMFIISLFF